METLGIVLPVFGLIAAGYLARRSRLVGERVGDGLSEFVFTVAVPCLIFRTLARADIPLVQPWGYWIAYFAGAGIAWALGSLATRRVFGQGGTVGVVAGFASAQANTIFVGVPLILRLYGDEGAVPLFLLIAVHLPVMMVVATLLAEGRGASPMRLGRRLLANPIVLAILVGVAVKPGIGWVPDPVWRTLDLLSGAAVPCALFALGTALDRYGVREGWTLPVVISGLKLLVHPLAVFVLARHVFTMPPAWSGVAVLFAACPCGVNAYLLAEHYKQGVGLASSAVAISTAFSLVTTLLWLYVLGLI